MWTEYINAGNLAQVLKLLAEHGSQARIVAGGTDLMLEMERGVRKGLEILIDISRIPGMDEIVLDEQGFIHLGPLVTHNHCAASKLIVENAFPLAMACYEVGAPQIRNRGTVAGNLITASPANDTITPLMALGASVVLSSVRGERTVKLEEFYRGVRKTVMQPDEMLVDIFFRAMPMTTKGTFIKIGLRRAQAISVVNAAVILVLDAQNEIGEKIIRSASITLGSVAPTVVHAVDAEAFLIGKKVDVSILEHAAKLAQRSAQPIDDVRGSAAYRMELVRVSVLRALRQIASETYRSQFPRQPVMLWGSGYQRNTPNTSQASVHVSGDSNQPIITTINGKQYTFTGGQDKSLLRLLREDAGLIGTKEGCAEGECGACTVILDGQAVMSCLVPAPRAHGAVIQTIEGLAQDGKLHPVQEAFIQAGAVQCGYCTPGFLMSAAVLLEEQPKPSKEQIQQAITGNLCRCTGYYKIIEAIEKAVT